MKKNKWKKVENIFHTTLDLPSVERKNYLQTVCAGDGELLSEVESLINSLETKSDFLDEDVFELGLNALYENGGKNLTGLTIGTYEVKDKIGAGGMGEVYKALDTQLNRIVALKFISESLENDGVAKRQLIKEAQAAAALEHPNICGVYGIEQVDEHHFIVMQYIQGKTLIEIIENEIVGVKEFKSLANQILTAVAFAHSHGIIHRDLKPGNIMLTNEEHIKVLDFGLAKIIHHKHLLESEADNKSSFSQTGLIFGTVSYMSPEQLRGEKVDYRSDIFSVGVILYELVIKQNPFSRKSQAETISAILNDAPPASEKLAADFPASLRNLVEKCLQKEPEKRFQSAAEVLVELDKTESESYLEIASKRRGKFYVKAAAAFAGFVLLAVLATVFFGNGNSPKRTLAVIPISSEISREEKKYLADGVTQGIIEKLSNVSDLDVKNESLLTRYRGKALEPSTAGKELNVDAIFVGNIQESAGRLILTSKLIRISDGAIIDINESEIDETKLLELLENITSRIVEKIELIELPQSTVSRIVTKIKSTLTTTKKDTESEKAQELYFQGRLFMKKKGSGNVEGALEFFNDAKDLDPNYAKAWAGLADAYILQSAPGVEDALTPKQAFESAKKAANKALELDPGLCEVYNSLGTINLRYDWNWVEAERNFRMAIRCDVEFLPARFGLINVLRIQERYGEAITEAEKIKKIDPLSIQADVQIALIHYFKNDYGQMDGILSDLRGRSPNDRQVQYTRVYQLLKTGRFEEAVAFLEPFYASSKEEDKVLAAAPLGFAYAKMKRTDKALKIIEDLAKFKSYIPAQESALIYVALGDYDKVFEFLNQSCTERFSGLPNWISDPLVDEVKSDARFQEIRKCINLEDKSGQNFSSLRALF